MSERLLKSPDERETEFRLAMAVLAAEHLTDDELRTRAKTGPWRLRNVFWNELYLRRLAEDDARREASR